MTLTPLTFDPPTGWKDSTVFPTFEDDEAQVRADLQRLHDQTRNYINGYTDDDNVYHDGLLDEIEAYIANPEVTVVDIASFNSLPKRFPASPGTSLKLTDDLVVVAAELGNPLAQLADWTVTTYDGYLEVTAADPSTAIGGSTTLRLILSRVGNELEES